MIECLQTYLPGFSPTELDSGKFTGPVIDFAASLIRVQKHYGDYHVFLTEAAIRKACTRINFSSSCPTIYQPVNAFIESDEPNLEVMQIRLTRDSSILWDYDHYKDIVFYRDEIGPLVWIYAPRVGQLLEENPQAQIMDRYDGHTNKIWISRDQMELAEVMLNKASKE